MTRRRLKITPVLVTLNVLVLLLIVAFYGTRMIKYYLKENGKSNDKDNTVLLVDTVLKKESYVDLTKGLIFDEEKNEYRYLGEVDDNYLEYSGILYRIIGIDKDKNIKVISDKGVTMMYSGLEKGYDKSYVNKWLNYDKDVPGSGVYENNIKESVNYLSSTYYCEDIIDDIKNITCDKNSTNYKISLLSLYDYYKAGGKSSFLNNGETFYLGTLNKDNHNYYITSDGEVSINEISTKTYAVRPVITIISSSVLLSGKGTKDDPYRILEIKPSTLEDTTINTYVSFSNQIFKVIDNSTDATKVALNGVIKENDIDVVKSFGGKNNKYSNSKNTVGYYLNNTYLKTLDSKNIIKSNWYIGALSLDNLDYSNEKNTKVNLSVGMLSLGDMFVGDINNVLTLSRGIESDQIINVINKEGNFYGDFITSKYNLRPALYLNNELKITGGNGTFDAPYELGVSDEKGQE
ncbi:MAG: hypothetical protein MSH48_00340 [Mollicutes bacterium]|nr:hypothetical protein [Mollicutes bacterium]